MLLLNKKIERTGVICRSFFLNGNLKKIEEPYKKSKHDELKEKASNYVSREHDQ